MFGKHFSINSYAKLSQILAFYSSLLIYYANIVCLKYDQSKLQQTSIVDLKAFSDFRAH